MSYIYILLGSIFFTILLLSIFFNAMLKSSGTGIIEAIDDVKPSNTTIIEAIDDVKSSDDHTLPNKKCNCKSHHDKCSKDKVICKKNRCNDKSFYFPPINNVQQKPVSVITENFSERTFQTTGSYLMNGSNRIYYNIKNQMKLKCFSSIINFSYNSANSNAVYVLDDSNTLLGNIVDGLAMVENNRKQSFYSFRSKYDSNSQKLTITILDNNGLTITTNGMTSITLMLSDCVESFLVSKNNGFSMPLIQTNFISR